MAVVSRMEHKVRLRNSRLQRGLTLIFGGLFAASAWAAEPGDRWLQIKNSLFGDRYIRGGEEILGLDTPERALDAAIVPVTIESKFVQTAARHIQNLYLVIENNPSPVAAVFHFSGAHPWHTLSTRVRVNAYTDLRAIAELSDGELYMVNNYVKASGGCSAPSIKDPTAATAQLGRMKFRLPETYEPGRLLPAQLLIKHPNSSGLQFDQVARYYIPADFVRTIQVTYNGEEVFSADTDISISEDPSIRFGFVPENAGVLEVHVKDSKGRTFSHSVDLQAQGEGS